MGVLSATASAIATQLGEMSQLEDVAVAVRHLDELDNSEMDALHVSVCPVGADISNLGRNLWQYEARVGVYVSRRAETNADAAYLLAIAEDVIESLKSANTSAAVTELLDAATSVLCTALIIDINTAESMNERNVFRATMEATYKIVKNVAAN